MLTPKAQKSLEERGFSNFSERCIRDSLPQINVSLQTSPPQNEELSTRLYGTPLLPKGTSWPQVNGKYLDFMLFINLHEFDELDLIGLPSNGFLSLFWNLGMYGEEDEVAVYYILDKNDLSSVTCPDPDKAEWNKRIETKHFKTAELSLSVIYPCELREKYGWENDAHDQVKSYYSDLVDFTPPEPIEKRTEWVESFSLGGHASYCQDNAAFFNSPLNTPKVLLSLHAGDGITNLFFPEEEIKKLTFQNGRQFYDFT